ncbi:hypothetical protein [Erysipelothrix rhusiopathiae]|uniref:hypothetical protein n=1 Tax=Erysipelothrix rhusiopathiae TaxID=1648 RepID=UPI000F433378|nr:hypothetical protein [Erysipelothrix rhusiopathiae]AYV33847.1 hypothetical protein EEY85_00430 [Erysipelothrix rhusiopathiae]
MIRKTCTFVMFIMLFSAYHIHNVSAEVKFEFQDLNSDIGANMRGICNRRVSCVGGSKTYTIQWLGMESGDEPISLVMQEEFKNNFSIEIGKITNLTKDTKSITIDNLVLQDSMDFNLDDPNIYHKTYGFKIHSETPNASEYRVIQTQNVINILRIRNQTIKFTVVRDGPINDVKTLQFVLTKNGERSKSLQTTHHLRLSSKNYSFITTKYDDNNQPFVFDIITDGDERIQVDKKVINDSEFEFRIRQNITKEIPLRGLGLEAVTGEVVLINENQKEIVGIVKDEKVVFKNIYHSDLDTRFTIKRYSLSDASIELSINEDKFKNISEINVERFINKKFEIEWGPNILAYPNVKQTDTIDIHLLEDNHVANIKKSVAFNQSELSFRLNLLKRSSFSVDDGFVIAANASKIYIDRAIQPLHIEIQKAYKPKKKDDIDLSVEIITPNISSGKIDLSELLNVEGFVIQENPKQEIKPNLVEMLSIEGFSVNEPIDEEPKNILMPDPVFLDGYSIEAMPSEDFFHGMGAILEKEIIKQKNLEQILEQDRKNRIAYELSIKEYEDQLKPISFQNNLEGEPIELSENAMNIQNTDERYQKTEEQGLFYDNQQVYSMVDVNGHSIPDHPSFDAIPFLVGTEIPEEKIDFSEMDGAYEFLEFIEIQKRVELERVLLQDIENRIQHQRESEKILNELYEANPSNERLINSYEIAVPYLIDRDTEGTKNQNNTNRNINTERKDLLWFEKTPTSNLKSLKKDRTPMGIDNHNGTDKQNFDEKEITRVIGNNKDSVLPKTGKQKHSNNWAKFLILTGVCVLLSKRYKNRILK